MKHASTKRKADDIFDVKALLSRPFSWENY